MDAQKLSCGDNETSTLLLLVKRVIGEVKFNDNVTHGAKVLLDIVLPWINTNHIVFGDVYFVSVADAELFRMSGFKYIGVTKIATKKYLMPSLGAVELKNQLDRFGLIRVK